MKKALLVIDMLHDFIDPAGALYCGSEGEKIVPVIKNIIEEFLSEGAEIFYICDSHREDDLEFKRFPKHCVTGTIGAEVSSSLNFACKDDHMILKQRYSAFYQTNLEEKLVGIDEVVLVGVCTNICVLFTAEELCNRDKRVIVYKDAVASFDKKAHENALAEMKNVLGVIIK